jgi:hypothetical protein
MPKRWTRKNRPSQRPSQRRKQKGGAINDIEGWISAVNASPAFMKADPIYQEDKSRTNPAQRLGSYTFSQLKQAELKLPPFRGYDDAFDLNRFLGKPVSPSLRDGLHDRQAILHEILRDIISENPTPWEFVDYIKNIENNPDYALAIKYMLDLENMFRPSGSKITSFSESSQAPFYIWALVMNPPEIPVEVKPSLLPVPPAVPMI